MPISLRLRLAGSELLTSRWSLPPGGGIRNFSIVPQSALPHLAIATTASFSAVTQRPVIGSAAKAGAMAAAPSAIASAVYLNVVIRVILTGTPPRTASAARRSQAP